MWIRPHGARMARIPSFHLTSLGDCLEGRDSQGTTLETRAHYGGSRTFDLNLRILDWPLGLGYGVTMVDDDRK